MHPGKSILPPDLATKWLHNSVLLVILKHMCGNFLCHILKENIFSGARLQCITLLVGVKKWKPVQGTSSTEECTHLKRWGGVKVWPSVCAVGSWTLQLLYRNVQRSRGGLVFKAHRLVYHSILGLRVIKKKRRTLRVQRNHVSVMGVVIRYRAISYANTYIL